MRPTLCLLLLAAAAAAAAGGDECGDGSATGPLSAGEVADWEMMRAVWRSLGPPDVPPPPCWSVDGPPARVCDRAGDFLSPVASSWGPGILCSSARRVTALSLFAFGLAGELTEELAAHFGALRELSLGGNSLVGTLPARWNASRLTSLDLSLNALSGTLPERWEGLGAVTTLKLAANRLSGPPRGNWSSVGPALSKLYLDGNRLSGEVPARWAGLDPAYYEVSFRNNALHGALPASFEGLSGRIGSLQLSGNSLDGALPRRITGLDGVAVLRLDRNNLNGEVPAAFDGLADVLQLDLSWNQLSGTVPAAWSGLDRLTSLSLTGNPVSGTVPGEWSGLDQVGTLTLGGSKLLSGTLPPGGFRGLPALTSLLLTSCGVSGTLPSAGWGAPGAPLFQVDLSRCALTGTLPSEWDGAAPRALSVRGNRLSGTVPAAWRGAEGLQELNAAGNLLSGALPARLSGLPLLERLLLGGNRLDGVLPPAWEGAGNLTHLGVGFNLLSGRLPARYDGLARLETLDAGGNRIGGTLPPAWAGLPGLRKLVLSSNSLSGSMPPSLLHPRDGGLPLLYFLDVADNELDGVLPNRTGGGGAGDDDADGGARGQGRLESLDVSGNRLSGLFPTGGVRGAPLIETLSVSGNLLSGVVEEAPGAFARAFPSLSTFRAAANRLSGTLPTGQPRAWLQTLREVDLAYNALSGAVPAGLLSSTVRQFDLTGNRLSRLDFPRGAVPPLTQAVAVLLSHNLLQGDLDEAMCRAAPQATHFDLSHNRLNGTVPACMGQRPGLLSLDLSHNLLRRLPAGFATREGTSLRVLRLRGNLLDGSGLMSVVAPGAGESRSAVAELDLRGNPLRLEVGEVVRRLLRSYPRLSRLELGDTGLAGQLLDDPKVVELDLGGNRLFDGFNAAVRTGALESLNVSGTSFTNVESGLARMRAFERRDLEQPARCLGAKLLRSDTLERIDVRGIAPRACLRRTLGALRESDAEVRYFAALNLTCPQWLTRASGARVQADADFLAMERCRCVDLHAWNGTSCAPFPPRLAGLVRNDPFVLAAAPCVLGNVYPATLGAGSDGASWLPPRAGDLLLPGTALLPCRRPGVCNARAADCARAMLLSRDHTVANASAPPLRYACGPGADPHSLMCSRCAERHWRSGDACVPCHAAFRYVAPLAVLAAAAASGALLWRKASRASDGYRTLSVAVFWLQITSLLEASSQVHGSNRQTSTWAWLAAARGSLASWAVVRPWALECVLGSGRDDFVASSYVVLAAPAAVVLLAGAARALTRPAGQTRVRLSYGALFLLHSMFLPVTTRAVQLFSCDTVSAGGASASFLNAAPYLPCGSARLGPLRAVAAATLALYCVPLLVYSWVALRRWRRDYDARAAPGLALPLLDADEIETGADEPPGGARESRFGRDMAARVLLDTMRHPRRDWWWPLAYDLGRALALALLVGLLPVTSPLLPVGVFAVLAVALLVYSNRQPAFHGLDNSLEMLVLLAALGVYLLNIVGGRSIDTAGSSSSSTEAVRSLVSVVHVTVLLAIVVALVARPVGSRLASRPSSRRGSASGGGVSVRALLGAVFSKQGSQNSGTGDNDTGGGNGTAAQRSPSTSMTAPQ